MQAAVNYVTNHPGCAILPVAEHIGPSRRFGYAAVHRAIKAGLIDAVKTARYGAYSLTIRG
jgi:hypothetical protein